jgi:hypothetical protein
VRRPTSRWSWFIARNVALAALATFAIAVSGWVIVRDPTPAADTGETVSVQAEGTLSASPADTSASPSPGPSASPTASPSSSTPARQPKLVVLGDGIAGTAATNWPAVLAGRLNAVLVNRAQSGTGYTVAPQSGTKPYPDRVEEIVGQHPDVVIVEGSRNDKDAGRTRTAAEDVFQRLRRGLPDAKVLVIGPIYSSETRQGTVAVNEAVKAAARAAGLPYLDPVADGWFTGPAHDHIGPDGVYPTEAGHRYLVSLIEPQVQRLLATPSSSPSSSP